MPRHAPSQQQQSYDASLADLRTSVYWQFEDHRQIWAFDDLEEPPPRAPDWFFVVDHPRTGSSVTVKLLNAHPQVYCGMEEQVLPLFMTILGSPFFLAPELSHAVRYRKAMQMTPLRLRYLLDGWRHCQSDRPIFGDKGDMYYSHFGEACEKVFPSCKFLLTVRDPLDTLSSFIRQPWTAYLFKQHEDSAAYRRALRARAYGMLERNRTWRGKAEVIRFEEMVSRDRFETTFRRVFKHLEADPAEYDWDAGWKLCAHRSAIGRWRNDRQILEFVKGLADEDPFLHDLLLEGAYFLPDGATRPEDGSNSVIEPRPRTA